MQNTEKSKCNLSLPLCEVVALYYAVGIVVAKSTYYKQLWAYFSVKSLTDIGIRGLCFFGLISKVWLFIWAGSLYSHET